MAIQRDRRVQQYALQQPPEAAAAGLGGPLSNNQEAGLPLQDCAAPPPLLDMVYPFTASRMQQALAQVPPAELQQPQQLQAGGQHVSFMPQPYGLLVGSSAAAPGGAAGWLGSALPAAFSPAAAAAEYAAFFAGGHHHAVAAAAPLPADPESTNRLIKARACQLCVTQLRARLRARALEGSVTRRSGEERNPTHVSFYGLGRTQ